MGGREGKLTNDGFTFFYFLDCGAFEYAPPLDLRLNSPVSLSSPGFPLRYESNCGMIWNVSAPQEASIQIKVAFFKVVLFNLYFQGKFFTCIVVMVDFFSRWSQTKTF